VHPRGCNNRCMIIKWQESSQEARVSLKISVLCCLPARGWSERAKRTAKSQQRWGMLTFNYGDIKSLREAGVSLIKKRSPIALSRRDVIDERSARPERPVLLKSLHFMWKSRKLINRDTSNITHRGSTRGITRICALCGCVFHRR